LGIKWTNEATGHLSKSYSKETYRWRYFVIVQGASIYASFNEDKAQAIANQNPGSTVSKAPVFK
jgi:hypothetical protein